MASLDAYPGNALQSQRFHICESGQMSWSKGQLTGLVTKLQNTLFVRIEDGMAQPKIDFAETDTYG